MEAVELNSTALVSIPVGVVVERHKATSQWLDFVWRPESVYRRACGGALDAAWTRRRQDDVLWRQRHDRAASHRDGKLPQQSPIRCSRALGGAAPDR